MQCPNLFVILPIEIFPTYLVYVCHSWLAQLLMWKLCQMASFISRSSQQLSYFSIFEGSVRRFFLILISDMEFVKKITPPDFQAKNFTPSMSPNFNNFSGKKHKKWVKVEKFTPLAKVLHCRRQWRQWQIPPLTDLWISTVLIFGQNRNKNRRGNSILLKIQSNLGIFQVFYGGLACVAVFGR